MPPRNTGGFLFSRVLAMNHLRAQGVSFIVSVILARILDPTVYGTVALITVFTAILQVFIDSGLGNALIQKAGADDLDFSTVFYFNVCMCFIAYIVLFALSPLIADFYGRPELCNLIRVLGLTLIISGVKNIQQAYVSRNLLFRKFFFATIGGTIAAAVIGIIMAFKGYGIWALIMQQLTNATIDTIILFITVKWRPKAKFSFARLKTLYSYGWKLLASSLIDTIYNNVRQLIIGKMYSGDSLAYYNRGKNLPHLIITNINTSIDSVLLPVMSSEQDNIKRVKIMTRRSIKTGCYIIWPIMLVLAITGNEVISILLTDKWLPSVPYLRIFCFTYALWPVHTANLNAIKAVGRSDLFLKLEIIKKLIGIAGIIISVRHGVFAIALMMAITAPISGLINAAPNKKLLNYSYREQFIDIVPNILLAFISGTLAYSVGYIAKGNWPLLILKTAVTFCSYILLSYIFKVESFDYIQNYVKQKIRKH